MNVNGVNTNGPHGWTTQNAAQTVKATDGVNKMARKELSPRDELINAAILAEKIKINNKLRLQLSDPTLFGGSEVGMGGRRSVLKCEFDFDVTEDMYKGWISEVKNNGVKE